MGTGADLMPRTDQSSFDGQETFVVKTVSSLYLRNVVPEGLESPPETTGAVT
jgi:hypothetical protein